ncbi:MAG: hypothetical protein ACJATN_002094 [Neolewinella sp.]|jgi:hypothetical protein
MALYSRREHEVKTFARTGDRKGSAVLAVGRKAVFPGTNTFSPQVTGGSIAITGKLVMVATGSTHRHGKTFRRGYTRPSSFKPPKDAENHKP